MHVLYFHQHFATRAGAGGTRSYEFARRLVAAGHSVTMVAGRRRNQGTSGAGQETIDGIDVISVGGQYENRLGTYARLRRFGEYALAADRVRPRSKPDVVVASSTPLTVGIPGVRAARRHGVPLVFEVRDLWPEAPIQLGVLRDPASRFLARRLERWCYRNSTEVIALSPGMAEGVLDAGVPAERVSCIPNCSDTDLFGPEHRDRSVLARWGLEDRMVAVHAGSMGRANGLALLVDEATELQRRGEQRVAVLICGDGGTRDELEATVRERGLGNVVFAGQVPRGEVGAIVSSADVAITSFLDIPILGTNSPNKLFDGLAAGIPNVVNSRGWTRPLVTEADAGCFVDPAQPGSLADALQRYADDPQLRERQGRHARELACDRFDRDLLAREFEQVLERAATSGTPAGGARA